MLRRRGAGMVGEDAQERADGQIGKTEQAGIRGSRNARQTSTSASSGHLCAGNGRAAWIRDGSIQGRTTHRSLGEQGAAKQPNTRNQRGEFIHRDEYSTTAT